MNEFRLNFKLNFFDSKFFSDYKMQTDVNQMSDLGSNKFISN